VHCRAACSCAACRRCLQESSRNNPVRYRRQIVNNADFQNFDDGLRMTVDCTPITADAIEMRLAAAQEAGICRIGTHRQTSANLTCFVPSPNRADHLHFVDGAGGGYATAAAKLKAGSHRKAVSRGNRS
jgi:hypothetical protein